MQNHFARCRLFEPADEAQSSGLAAAGRAEEGIKTAAFEPERDTVDRAMPGELLR